jgi:hypothetical protein
MNLVIFNSWNWYLIAEVAFFILCGAIAVLTIYLFNKYRQK